MPSDQIQWFPGHMAKTRRIIKECLPLVDIVIELLDARIPRSSRNPEIKDIIGSKPSLTLLNKSTLADPGMNKIWKQYLSDGGRPCILTDCINGQGLQKLYSNIQSVLSDKIEKYENKGMSGRKIKAMIVGIPNVGKSSLINKLSGAKKAKVEDRPGVTMMKQWVTTNVGLDLLDMPGVLWPKFDDEIIGENLAITGAIKDNILYSERIAVALIRKLKSYYPHLLSQRYKLTSDDLEIDDPYELFLVIGKKRGMVISGGEIDEERTANMILNEFRSQKIGAITLERPEEIC